MPNHKTGKNVNCKHCGKEYYVNRARLEQNRGIYCSEECQRKGQIPWNKGLTKEQDERLQSISRKTSEQIKIQYENGMRDRFAITKAANEAVRQKSRERYEKSPNKYISIRGYWMVYVPQRGWVNEHIFIWEKENGPVPKGMHIHHINHNRLDNRLENLKMLTSSEHHKLHVPPFNHITGRFMKGEL